MGQRIKRDLASRGENRGSRAGEHEQPNAGRKRKCHVFCLRFVGRTLSHARRQGVTRSARTCENRARKASQETTRTSLDQSKSRPRRSKTPLGAQLGKHTPSQAVPGRSGDAPKAAHNAPGWLCGRARGAPGGAHRIRGASGNAPEGGGDALRRKSYAAVAQHALRSTLATFFRQLWRFAQTGRHAFRLSFHVVLTEFDEVGVSGTPQNGRPGRADRGPGTVRASKIEAQRPSSIEKTEPERNAVTQPAERICF